MNGRYTIESRIAKSLTGDGNVYVVSKNGRKYCLKTAKKGRHHNLEAEADALEQLNHPNIVKLHDKGTYRDEHYIVTELMEGNLRDLIKQGIDAETAKKITIQILNGLQYAHEHRIMHLDLKPENILISGETAKICDFSAPLEDRVDNSMGSNASLLTTQEYRAPEIREGKITPTADVYSTGVMLYEMLTGKLPTLKYKKPSETANTPEILDELVDRMLEDEENRIDIHTAIRTLSTKTEVSKSADTTSLTAYLRLAHIEANSLWTSQLELANYQLSESERKIQGYIQKIRTAQAGFDDETVKLIIGSLECLETICTAAIDHLARVNNEAWITFRRTYARRIGNACQTLDKNIHELEAHTPGNRASEFSISEMYDDYKADKKNELPTTERSLGKKIAVCAAPILLGAAAFFLTRQEPLPEDPLFYWKGVRQDGECYVQFPYGRDASAGVPRNYLTEETAIPVFEQLLKTMNAVDVKNDRLDGKRAVYDVTEVRQIILKLSDDGKITENECNNLLKKIERTNEAFSLIAQK